MPKRFKYKKTPIFSMLDHYSAKKAIRYHMPAHKGSAKFKKLNSFSNLIDITELSFSDNLHDSSGVIKQAEDLFANVCGCKSVKFSTSGSTVGVLSAIYSATKKGDKIIIARCSHKSVYSAIKICGLKPVIIDNDRDELTGLYKNITLNDIKATITNHPDCSAVVITTPDYYGNLCGELESIINYLKQNNKISIIDNAHGAHLPFLYQNKNFDKRLHELFVYTKAKNFVNGNFDVMSSYTMSTADIYICSAHKTLPSLTSSAFICINNQNLIERFTEGFSIFHTSSPSYITMASIDFAREYMLQNGATEMLKNYIYFIKKLSELTFHTMSFLASQDFCKLTIFCKSGGKLLNRLLEANNIYAELSGENHVLLMLSCADSEKDYKKTIKLLLSIDKVLIKDKHIDTSISSKITNIGLYEQKALQKSMFGKSVLDYNKAYDLEKKYIDINQSVGKICGGEVGLYPPAIPIIVTGDLITKEICEYLIENKKNLFGLKDGLIPIVVEN